MDNSRYIKAAKIAAIFVGFVAPFGAKYGIESQAMVDAITGACMIGLAAAPSILAILKK